MSEDLNELRKDLEFELRSLFIKNSSGIILGTKDLKEVRGEVTSVETLIYGGVIYPMIFYKIEGSKPNDERGIINLRQYLEGSPNLDFIYYKILKK